MHSRVFLHLSDQSPVRLSRVHLASCASVDGQSLDSHILKSLGKLNDDFRILIPSQSGLYGHRKLHGLNHLSGDLHHLIRFSHHSGASTSSCNLVHRTTEIDVHKVCTMPSGNLCRSFRHHGRIHHGLRNVAIDLDSDRSLVLICDELLERLSCVADKSVRRDELGVHHVGSELLADEAERRVSHVLHRCEEQRSVSEFYVSYLHKMPVC